jgi:hypothetical protein
MCRHGATDLNIHDIVLIAAAFCIQNRYVDGLATWQPRNDGMYLDMGLAPRDRLRQEKHTRNKRRRLQQQAEGG